MEQTYEISPSKQGRTKMKMAAVLLTLALAGCATVGKEISPGQLSGFKEGESTSNNVIEKLGSPTTTSVSGDRTIMVYSFVHTQARPESFIPLVGAFVGGADVRASSATFIFGKDGKLERYSHTVTKTGSGTGLASGRYTEPNRSLPKEAN
jgi:outer membrane protein assembly factor BamE (lipoprotein component of BamABCDE complex)